MDDEAIRARIRTGYQELGQIWCPHTATAAEAYARLPAQRRESGRWVLVSTAHPAKFREIVEPLIGRDVAVPESLTKLFARPTAVHGDRRRSGIAPRRAAGQPGIGG